MKKTKKWISILLASIIVATLSMVASAGYVDTDPACRYDGEDVYVIEADESFAYPTPIPEVMPYAATGTWHQEADGRWWFEYTDGGYPVSKFEQIGASWYYFDDQGYMVVSSWVYVGGHWYYLSSTGSMVVGWFKVGETRYYFDYAGHATYCVPVARLATSRKVTSDHEGWDFIPTTPGVAGQDNIRAFAKGTVNRSEYSSSYGNVVYIWHNYGPLDKKGYTYIQTIYAHMYALSSYEINDVVEIGSLLGLMGNTGKVQGEYGPDRGTHLHFETKGGNSQPQGAEELANMVDPALYFDSIPSTLSAETVTTLSLENEEIICGCEKSAYEISNGEFVFDLERLLEMTVDEYRAYNITAQQVNALLETMQEDSFPQSYYIYLSEIVAQL